MMSRTNLALAHIDVPEPEENDLRDIEAVERCLAGDRDAFGELVERYKNGIFALCVRLSGTRAVGEELAQEAFARAYSSLGSWRRDARFKHWLYRIAMNLCRDFAKASGRRERPSPDPGDEPLEETHAQGPADPQSHTLSRETLSALERAVERLSPKYREAFVLKHVEGLAYEEMKVILKAPVPVLKVRVHRAREKLRVELAELLS